MSQEIREFVAGDKIAITTTLELEANIAGITVSYHSENEPHASYGALAFSQGSTDTMNKDSLRRESLDAVCWHRIVGESQGGRGGPRKVGG